jgi:tRNA (mo5U34)-methyltransferase
MINYQRFYQYIESTPLARHKAAFEQAINQGLSVERYGDLPMWIDALHQLPDIEVARFDLKHQVSIGHQQSLPQDTTERLETALRCLMPWRKGPITLFDIKIDTEWRSDWKWDRLLPHITPLKNRKVLDVGCGNGYHCFRSAGEEAAWVLGIDPSPRFVVQFHMVKKYLPHLPLELIPLTSEQLPPQLGFFDTVFSMGVLYHRRSPLDHLRELKEALIPGGELVLETLVIEGDERQVLVPQNRYAMMNNVWFIPSPTALVSWLSKMGFKRVRVVDQAKTRVHEQRSTDWMRFQSLTDFLDPKDQSLTVEGYPAPTRAIIVAEKPLE